MSEGRSAAVLRDSRRRAGLTQLELSILAGVTQSVISAYESGHRQPSLPALERLVDATGHELDIRVRRPPRRLQRLTGPVGVRVRRQRPSW